MSIVQQRNSNDKHGQSREKSGGGKAMKRNAMCRKCITLKRFDEHGNSVVWLGRGTARN